MSTSPNNSVNASKQERAAAQDRALLAKHDAAETVTHESLLVLDRNGSFVPLQYSTSPITMREAEAIRTRERERNDGKDRQIPAEAEAKAEAFSRVYGGNVTEMLGMQTQAQTRWTLQQFSTNPVGEPWVALQERNQAGEVQRGFTGTRREMDEIISEHNLTVTEIAPVKEHQYETQRLNDDAALDLPIGALAARSALEAERQSILAEAQTPHEAGLDGALKSYVNGRVDAYNNIRNALAESSTVELPSVIEAEEIAVIAPELAMDDRQQSFSLGL